MTESNLEREAKRYELHHAVRRDDGELVFVPERVAIFKGYVGGPGRDVLDLGCRVGAVTRHYAEGNRIVGVDLDRGALARISAELGVQPVWGDVEQPLPFEDSTFDVVVRGELLEHLREPSRVLDEMHRVLRPGGRLVGWFRMRFGSRDACSSWPVASPKTTPRISMSSIRRRSAGCCPASATSGCTRWRAVSSAPSRPPRPRHRVHRRAGGGLRRRNLVRLRRTRFCLPRRNPPLRH